MPDVRQIDRRRDARGAVHRARVVHHAEQLRRFCRDAVQNFIKAERPGLTKHLQQIEKLRLVAARGERLAHRSGAVVVPLAGGAAEQ